MDLHSLLKGVVFVLEASDLFALKSVSELRAIEGMHLVVEMKRIFHAANGFDEGCCAWMCVVHHQADNELCTIL